MTSPLAPQGHLERLLRTLFRRAQIVSIAPLGEDAGGDDTRKGGGYSEPLLVTLRDGKVQRQLVFRTASPNDFGHDRRADRAANLLLAHDTFAAIPNHIRALDVGAIAGDGTLVSLHDSGEFYLLTSFAEGTLYADDLRRVSQEGVATAEDLGRCEALADYLVHLHSHRGGRHAAYTRSVRDLVGSGEGIFGIVDGYDEEVPGASRRRLQTIEKLCLDWRWRLRGRESRLCRIHGDFHPFNLLFAHGTDLALLDASRGGLGDPADDVTCLAVNYVFFAIDHPDAWSGGLGPLWRRFWSRYLDRSGDSGLLEVAAPYLAWRCLVVACPRFYPDLTADGRDRLLTLAERALQAQRFEATMAEELAR